MSPLATPVVTPKGSPIHSPTHYVSPPLTPDLSATSEQQAAMRIYEQNLVPEDINYVTPGMQLYSYAHSMWFIVYLIDRFWIITHMYYDINKVETHYNILIGNGINVDYSRSSFCSIVNLNSERI